MAQESSVRTVERALDILDCFAEGGAGSYTLTEISQKTGLNLSTALRLLSALEKRGYLHRSDDMKYYLGFRLAQLSNLGFDNLDFVQIARPWMEKIEQQFQESVTLYSLNGRRRVVVGRVEGERRLRSVVRIGDSYTLTRGASGRVLLAYQSEELVAACQAENPYDSVETPSAIRAQGYALSYGERDEGVTSIAVPIFNARGEAVASLCSSGAKMHFDEAMMRQLRAVLLEAGQAISAAMGYREHR